MKHSFKRMSLLLLAACASLALAQTPSLSVSPQDSSDGGVTIDSVTLVEDGFVVVHAFDTMGELVLTPPLGLTYLEAGTHQNVPVALDPMLLEQYGYGSEAKDVLPMLHIDGNDNGSYEFPEGPDVPVMVGEDMVVATLSLTLASMDGMGHDMNESMGSMTGLMLAEGTFEIALSGAQEVPAVMTDASGTATVSLQGSQLSVSGDFAGLSSPLVAIAGTPGHIHLAPFGENGDVSIPLNVTAAEDGSSGLFSAEAELDDAQLEAFKAGHFYINLHTEMHESGELRGQLVPQDALMGLMGLTPSLGVSAQTLEMNAVTLNSVTLAEDGFVVIHAFDGMGELVLTPPLGLAYLEAGTHEHVQVTLDPALLAEYGYGTGGKDVLPMLHIDGNDNATYEFPDGPDVPVMLDGEMVVATLGLTLP